MTNIYTARNKSELESFSQNKTIFFQELAATLFSQRVSPSQCFDLRVRLNHALQWMYVRPMQGC